MTEHATLERRLANFRAALARGGGSPLDGGAEPAPRAPIDLAARMAAALDGELVATDRGTYVRVESPTIPLPLDRGRLASLPGQPPADVPLVCLDTETTGLGTAAGTYAFLVGLGWWQRDRFRTVQLVLPDQPHEPALLAAIAGSIPPEAWLVSYNGRGFDWPLLVTRFRMARSAPPPHDGHLDLLPLVRRLFRHRMVDARLRTVEETLLGIGRHEDVEGWEIPGRYLDFLRTGLPHPLVAVARHNGEDVRSLARLLVHLETCLGDVAARRTADSGDVAGLARLFVRERRLEAALDCLEAALLPRPAPLRGGPAAAEVGASYRAAAASGADARWRGAGSHPAPSSRRPPVIDEWWSPSRPADFGGPPRRTPIDAPRLAAPWSEERLLVERAHVLRRLGRLDEAAATWADLAVGTSRLSAVASVELAKLREHRLDDLSGALEATRRAWTIVDRRRRIGRPEVRLEADLVRRGTRLRRRLGLAAGEATPAVARG